MKEHKIVFTGTMGAGKTTAIAAISDAPPVSTDVSNTDQATSAKATTTVGLDFGQVMLDNGDRLRLFGTPGQIRFDFMWNILIKNAIGLIILVDNSRPDPIADLATYIDGFETHLREVPCTIGIGRSESHSNPSIDDFGEYLMRRGFVLPVLPVDVRRREDVSLLIDTLLAQAEAAAQESFN